MSEALSPPSFEEIFRFPTPSAEQVEDAADDMSGKVTNDGLPVGTMAFFSVPGLQDVSMEFVRQTATSFAKTYEVDGEAASMMVYVGFIGALELFAALRLRSED